MTKEQLAILVTLVGLVATIFSAGQRIGILTERVETQGKQIELLTNELRAVNQHFIAYTLSHRD